ncbi:MAG TPA: pyruvate kinase [Pseudomonadota bacterium]|nr:pyruvate kinase [Pseudomonadota bacterium]
MRRYRKAKIVATLGSARSDEDTIRALFEAGADAFRFNFSHGAHPDHQARYDIVRKVEQETGRPIAVLADLRGPKLGIGKFADGLIKLAAGASFDLDLDDEPGDQNRVGMPHPEIFQALKSGVELLARRMSLVWGVRSIIAHEPHDIADVTANASRIALDEDLRTIWAMPPLAGGEREEHKDV